MPHPFFQPRFRALLRIRSQGSIRRSAGLILALSLMMAAQPAFASKYAAYIVDVNSGRVLHAANPDEIRFPASLTKIMTLYVVFEMIEAGRLTLDSELIITETAARQPPTKIGLPAGARIRLEDAIAALVTKSANDIAVSIAENIAGTEAKFARYMTWKARQLGMGSTVFRNASGLPDTAQVTTARDMATLALAIMDDYPQHYGHFSKRSFRFRGKRYRNHNTLLRNYTGTDGIKTGYTRASGFNLVASVRRSGKHLVGVVLGGATAKRRNTQMRRLLTRAFKKASKTRTRRRHRIPSPQLVARNRGATSAAALSRGYSGLTRSQPNRTRETGALAYASTGGGARTLVKQFVAPNPVPVTRSSYTGSAGLNSSQGTPESAGAPVTGAYHVQVGAFDSQADADRRLGEIAAMGHSATRGRATFTMRYKKGSRTYFRARFVGYAKPEAKSACAALKANGVDCIVMAGN